LLILIGYVGLLLLRRWESDLLLAVGLCLPITHLSCSYEGLAWTTEAALWLVFLAYSMALKRWLWHLPLRRAQACGVLCSLLLGAFLVIYPYWVGKHFGHGANLQRAVLILADLRDADLRGADLRGADLRGATLFGADLTGANLAGAKLEYVW